MVDRMIRTVLPSRATMADVGDLARLFAVAFATDPVFGWISRQGEERIPALERFWQWVLVERSIAFDEVWKGDGTATIWLPPGAPASPGGMVEQLRLMPLMLRLCGVGRILRGVAVAQAMENNHPQEPHYYLLSIAVAPEHQGRGLGSAMLAANLQRADAARMPAYLENSNPRNTPLYERHGFVAQKNIAPKGCPPLLAMWRKRV